MKKVSFLAIAILLLLFASGCRKNTGAVDYLYLPFSSRAEMTVGGSEFTLDIKKGGGNLVEVSVLSPEALRGMRLLLDEDERVVFDTQQISSYFPESVADTVYSAFTEANTLSVSVGKKTTDVTVLVNGKKGVITVDNFTKAPLSLIAGGITMKFFEFER